MFPQFDEHKVVAFHKVLDLMGEQAVWLKSMDEIVHGNILFKQPTKPLNIGNSDNYEYMPNTPTAEWYKDTFVGLKELSDAGSNEYLMIRGCKYFVVAVNTTVDGDTYIANIELTGL